MINYVSILLEIQQSYDNLYLITKYYGLFFYRQINTIKRIY